MVGNAVPLRAVRALLRPYDTPWPPATRIPFTGLPTAASANPLFRRLHSTTQSSSSSTQHGFIAPWTAQRSNSIATPQISALVAYASRINASQTQAIGLRSHLLQSWPRPSTFNYTHRRSFSTSRRRVEEKKGHTSEKGAKDMLKATSSSQAAKATRSIYDRLPNISQYHRPSREELLAAATGFWSRLKIRFKWFSIRSARPFNSDEIGALFSWVILGHILWIILGTTTFASLLILTFNTVFAQETLARWVGNYLTKSSGVTVVFESAIVPRWRGGVITFKNVFVSRRPGQGSAKVSKGSAETAAAAAAASALAGQARTTEPFENEDTNYTQYDLTLNTVDVTLSFTKWFNGQGLLSDVEIKGVRGVVDRTHVYTVDEDIDPKSYRHEHNTGDFEIDSFKMEDFLVTVHQPGGFRPFSVSIFACDLPRLRQRWLFYDFLCANNVSGSFDDSLFTIHPRQVPGRPAAQSLGKVDDADSPSPWMKQSRLRVDSLSIDHLNRGISGPFSWIHEGNVDMVADVMFPADADDSLIAILMSELQNTRVAMSKQGTNLAEQGLAQTIEALVKSSPSTKTNSDAPKEDRRFLVMDLKVNFHDVRATVPLFTRDLTYVNNALIRPIVAYINSRNAFIPISCRLAKRVTDFDGSWTLYDSGLLDDISAETYTAITRDITDDQARIRRFKKVGLWSLQLAAQALFIGMAGVIA